MNSIGLLTLSLLQTPLKTTTEDCNGCTKSGTRVCATWFLLTREVREAFVECRSFFPHFYAPELLDEQQFRKFCYYAEKHHLCIMGDFPSNYLPHPYRDDPEEWEERRQYLKERARLFEKSKEVKELTKMMGLDEESDFCGIDSEDESSTADNGNDDGDQDKKPAAAESSTAKRPRSPETSREDNTKQRKTTTQSSINLLDMDENVKSVIASNLDVANWSHLRTTCKIATDWPLPFIDYDFFYFAISNCFNCVWQGVAHTMDDVREAMVALHGKEHSELWTHSEIKLHVDIIKFNQKKHAIAPLMTFEDYQYFESVYPASVHELGLHYFGVKRAFPPLDTSGFLFFKSLDNKDDIFEFEEEENKEYLSRFNGLRPVEPMNLQNIGIRKVCCSYCGMDKRCLCDLRFVDKHTAPDRVPIGGHEENEEVLYYSPTWFGNGKNRLLCSPVDRKIKRRRVGSSFPIRFIFGTSANCRFAFIKCIEKSKEIFVYACYGPEYCPSLVRLELLFLALH